MTRSPVKSALPRADVPAVDTLGGAASTRSNVRIFRHFLRMPLLLLAATEALAFLCAPMLARGLLGLPPIGAMAPKYVYAAAMMVAMLSMGLYSRQQRARLTGVLLRVMAALLVGSAASGLLAYLVPALSMERTVFLLAAPVAFLIVGVVRYVLDRYVDDDIFKRRVLVYGAGRRAASITQLRRRTDQRGFLICGYVETDGDRGLVEPARLVSPVGSLLQYCRAYDIDEIVVAMDDRRRAFPVHELLECRLVGIEITELVDFLERETGKVRLDVLNPSWIIFARGFRRTPLRLVTERALDIVASLGILALAWPLMLLTALAIKLEDGLSAPVLYGQTRVGLEGRHFRVLKFRSMRVDAERAGEAIWAQKRDPRVTRVGSFIRKTRLDELPQLFNVLRGDMSFVGPRPERPEFVTQLEQRIPYYRERHAVKPGITGWAQLCYPYGSSERDAAEKLQYDLYYVKNHSLLFDLMILVQTAEVVLWGKGAR
jgi:sugar transferase (PEP-CTERM system associated)